MSQSCCTANPRAHGSESDQPKCYYEPKVDILERDEEIVLLADLPGASPDSVAVDYSDGELTIEAKVEARQEPGTQYLVRQYGVGDYRRTFRVGEAVDTAQISAKFTDGVLAVHLPKVQSAKPRRITVHAN